MTVQFFEPLAAADKSTCRNAKVVIFQIAMVSSCVVLIK